MQRLVEIKKRLELIEEALNEQYPNYKSGSEITAQITELKGHVQDARKIIQKKKSQGELSDFEIAFIEPAINDVYLTSIDKIRRGAKPSPSVSEHIYDTSVTLDYWLGEIGRFKSNQNG